MICAISGKIDAITKGYECLDCGKWVLEDYYVKAVNACTACEKQRQSINEAEYIAKLSEVYADNVITEHERCELKALQSRLGLSRGRAEELERSKRRRVQVKMDESELIRLQQAERLLFADFKVDEAFEKLRPLHETYHRQDERLWCTYLYCLAEYDPATAEDYLSGLEVDDPQAHAVRVELLVRRGEFSEAGRLLRDSRQKFGPSDIWRAQEVNVLLEEYRQDHDKIWIERAEQKLDGPESEALSWVKAKLDWLKGNRESMRRGKESSPQDSLMRFLYLRSEKYLSIGSLKLHIAGKEYVCRSGDVIGRHGTLAKAQMGQIQTLSRRHAQVMLRAGYWHLRLLSATNSSSIDDKPIETDKFYRLGLENRVRLSSQCEFELKSNLTT
jgi:DNA-directed RNA polymerase subunit RPC12/RpoP